MILFSSSNAFILSSYGAIKLLNTLFAIFTKYDSSFEVMETVNEVSSFDVIEAVNDVSSSAVCAAFSSLTISDNRSVIRSVRRSSRISITLSSTTASSKSSILSVFLDIFQLKFTNVCIPVLRH